MTCLLWRLYKSQLKRGDTRKNYPRNHTKQHETKRSNKWWDFVSFRVVSWIICFDCYDNLLRTNRDCEERAGLAFRVKQMVRLRVNVQFKPVGHFEFVVDVREVMNDRFFGDEQPLGDLSVL